ncbi:MAG: ribonuclease HII [Alphaproteobacteria bacterium]
MDEAGRGPWAGPVVAAAVLFRERRMKPRGVNDSKKLARDAREALFEKIMKVAFVATGIASVEEIDALNIWGATSLAMRRALYQLPEEPHVALIDGNLMPKNLPCEARTVVKGDGISYSIAAASIVAKVTRDRLMRELAATYPHYGFDSHVGYGTPQHLNAIRAHGPCEIHRKRWPIQQLLQGELFSAPAESDATWAA